MKIFFSSIFVPFGGFFYWFLYLIGLAREQRLPRALGIPSMLRRSLSLTLCLIFFLSKIGIFMLSQP